MMCGIIHTEKQYIRYDPNFGSEKKKTEKMRKDTYGYILTVISEDRG